MRNMTVRVCVWKTNHMHRVMSHMQACLPASAWLVGSRKLISYAPLSTRLLWDSCKTPTFLLTDVWFALGCSEARLSRAARCSASEAAAHLAFIGFNGRFHTSLVHLMQRKIDPRCFWREAAQGEQISGSMCPPSRPFVSTAMKTLFPFCFMTLYYTVDMHKEKA